MSKESNLSPMQEQLLARADSILVSISNAVQQGAEFVHGQVPDIAIQYVAFGRAYYTALEIFWVALFAFSMWLVVSVGIKNRFKLPNAYGSSPNEGRVMTGILGIIGMVVSVFGVLILAKDFLMVWFAPKVWLITEIVRLIK